MKQSIINRGGLKSVLFVSILNISKQCSSNPILRIIGFPIRLFYRILSRNIMHVEICDTMEIGPGLILWHGGHGCVINNYTKIGCNFQIRQGTTIGSSSFSDNTQCPTIGDNVQVGPNCTILGKIKIGNYAIIGGGSVVVHDVPDYAVVAGNPAKIIKILEH